MADTDAAAFLAELTSLLRTYGEPRRATAAQRDKGSDLEFFAIRVPVLRRVATKEFVLEGLSPEERLAVWDYIWRHSPVYEVLSIPLLYYKKRGLRIEHFAFGTMRRWVDRVDDWGHCDGLSAVYAYLNHNRPDVVLPFLGTLNESQNIWKIRTSIVSLIHYTGKNAVYLTPDQTLPLLDRHLSNDNRYIANAVGWVLREMRTKFPTEVDDYVKVNATNLSKTAIRKARIVV